MAWRLHEAPPEALARRVYAALDAGESDARLLDGEKFKRTKWERARECLFELLRRLEART